MIDNEIVDILKIIDKYSKKTAMKQLTIVKKVNGKFTRPHLLKLYETAGIKPHHNVSSIAPWLKTIEIVFDPAKLHPLDNLDALKGLDKMINNTKMKFETRMAAKATVKKHVLKFNEPESLFHKQWLNSGLPVSKADFEEKAQNTQAAINIKNSNVLKIPANIAKLLYKRIFSKRKETIIDKIIIVQAALGLRLIEVLSSETSSFEIEKNKIKQTGTAKNADKQRIITKRLIKGIRPHFIIKLLQEIRAETDKLGLDNEALSEKYKSDVNSRIKQHLDSVGIPPNNELKSSHGLRRLYVATLYFLRSESDSHQTLHAFIKENLAHESDGATTAYNSIEIVPAIPTSKKFIKAVIKNTTEFVPRSKQFEKLQQLENDGITSYEDLNKKGFTRYMVNLYKKSKKKT